MARSLDDVLARRPVDRAAVDDAKQAMLTDVALHRLRELRALAPEGPWTQEALAAELGISQTRVSRLERGDIAHTEVETLRRYVTALGGRLVVEVELAGDRYQIA